MIPKESMDHKTYYSDGKDYARWDGLRNTFWVWKRLGGLKYMTTKPHSDDAIDGFEPRLVVQSNSVLEPLIFD